VNVKRNNHSSNLVVRVTALGERKQTTAIQMYQELNLSVSACDPIFAHAVIEQRRLDLCHALLQRHDRRKVVKSPVFPRCVSGECYKLFNLGGNALYRFCSEDESPARAGFRLVLTLFARQLPWKWLAEQHHGVNNEEIYLFTHFHRP
jgi:hypothetical protein